MITGVIVVLSLVIIRFSNDLLYYQKLVGEGTEASVTNILYDIERFRDFDPDTMQIVVIGAPNKALAQNYEMLDEYGVYPGIGPDGTTITYSEVFQSYLHYILGRNYSFNYSEELATAISDDEHFINMPSYPQDGYISVVNEYLVIKFEDSNE